MASGEMGDTTSDCENSKVGCGRDEHATGWDAIEMSLRRNEGKADEECSLISGHSC